ncbi:AAA family ATPase [Desulfobacula sp.]|uniref:ExeA family protein n=1 Tax=Desulfobacula sp. TaxID=2593537 RepID=UPI00262BA46B|nr:AAA family ATPase [Desulfobacula sp.]
MDYKKRYGLKEAPFGLSPDPEFFFPSETHRDALETLLYSIQSKEGFIQITGPPGTGKSMLLRKILKEMGDSVVVGLILHSNIQAGDLLPIIMQDLKIDTSRVNLPSRGNLVPLFRDFLLDQARAGNQVIIIVDEAQNLPDETLEELRMLSNLETEKAKLLQIILVGQVELEQRIRSEGLKQLSQRITVRYRLKPLTREETRSYIFHRLEIASLNRGETLVAFRPGVLGAIHKYSQGIPRLINIVCERCLMAAFIGGEDRISRRHLNKAILSIDGAAALVPGRLYFRPATWGLLMVFFLMVGLWGYLRVNPDLPLVSRALSSLTTAMTDAAPPQPPTYRNQPTPVEKKPDPVAIKTPEPEPPAQQPELSVVMEMPPRQPGPVINEFSFMDQWITLPPGVVQVGLINKARGTLLMVKQKKGEFFRSTEMPVSWPYPSGVYMAGYSPQDTPFIFHPEMAYIQKLELDNPDFWQLIRTGSKTITPLIVLASFDLLEKPPEQGGGDSVRRVVQNWADTWRSMDTEKLMGYFSNVTAIYTLGREQPLVYSKTRMKAIKRDILEQSRFIRLNFSEPICLINPLEPHLAYAVFHQTYQSKTFQDRGTKVLYFRRLDTDAAQSDWKITGKLWIPDPDITIADPMTP